MLQRAVRRGLQRVKCHMPSVTKFQPLAAPPVRILLLGKRTSWQRLLLGMMRALVGVPGVVDIALHCFGRRARRWVARGKTHGMEIVLCMSAATPNLLQTLVARIKA